MKPRPRPKHRWPPAKGRRRGGAGWPPLEALLEALEQASLLRCSDVDDTFLRLIAERFVAEATPVVGDAIAKRAAANLVG
ncbi:MAG: hypothetical protein AVDCRST_MAG73-1833 [uncultured Thermomicrobiales bacterium]|uniref:Uncharacterized protein n=1 Tax=uncultured Thermomicrobiales bacterium TaxID=1645740 RepID=A0A6J4U6N3_9BACT|nr:MAG: hypothetical protein AVDCRST_MAG73-1833 [uncultured Thermomicrobiales bacterium]